MLRDLWRAASRPVPFFQRRSATEPELGRAALAGLLSVGFALSVAALALARATGSDAYLLVLLAVLLAGSFAWLLAVGVGGLALMRPAQLDLRAWELVLWSWSPAGPLALSLLPLALLAPAPSLVLGYALTLGWHLVLVDSAIAVFAPRQRLKGVAWYLAAVILLPWGFFALALVLARAA